MEKVTTTVDYSSAQELSKDELYQLLEFVLLFDATWYVLLFAAALCTFSFVYKSVSWFLFKRKGELQRLHEDNKQLRYILDSVTKPVSPPPLTNS